MEKGDMVFMDREAATFFGVLEEIVSKQDGETGCQVDIIQQIPKCVLDEPVPVWMVRGNKH